MNNNNNVRYKESRIERDNQTENTRICFEVQAPSSTSPPSRVKDFHYLYLGLHKRYKQPLHKRWVQSQGTKPMHKVSHFYQEGRHKVKVQSKESDHKDHKQHLVITKITNNTSHKCKILKDRFYNE